MEQLRFVLGRILVSSSAHHKILLRKVCEILLAIEEEPAAAVGEKLKEWVVRTTLPPPPSFSPSHDEEAVMQEGVIEWVEQFHKVFKVLQEIGKWVCLLLETKWKEGVDQIATTLMTSQSKVDTLNILSVSFQVLDTILSLLETDSSHQLKSWLCNEAVNQLVEKMVTEWLPRLRLVDSSHFNMVSLFEVRNIYM